MAPNDIIKIDVVAGVDRFAFEGDRETAVKLYDEWIKRVDGLLSRSEGMFAASKSLGVHEAISAKTGRDN